MNYVQKRERPPEVLPQHLTLICGRIHTKQTGAHLFVASCLGGPLLPQTPEIFSQGTTLEEAESSLASAVYLMLKYKYQWSRFR